MHLRFCFLAAGGVELSDLVAAGRGDNLPRIFVTVIPSAGVSLVCSCCGVALAPLVLPYLFLLPSTCRPLSYPPHRRMQVCVALVSALSRHLVQHHVHVDNPVALHRALVSQLSYRPCTKRP